MFTLDRDSIRALDWARNENILNEDFPGKKTRNDFDDSFNESRLQIKVVQEV